MRENLNQHTRQALADISQRIAALITPPPLDPPWKWAETHLTLPKENAEPGRYRSNPTPWVREITDSITDPKYPEVVAVQGSQTGKTLGVLIAAACRQMHYRHKPCLLYEPTEDLADAVSDRLKKAILSVPALAGGYDERRSSKHEFWLYSVRLGLGWGGSASQTASHPAELILFDELDRLRANAEGNPWQQTKARKATYPLGTHVGASSPTLGMISEYQHPDTGLYHWEYQNEKEKVLSLTWQLWQEGTRGEYMLPCPECHTYFAPKGKLLLASFPEDATPEQALQIAGVVCPHCGAHIAQRHQQTMISQGKMISPGQTIKDGEVIGERPNTRIASFHVNGLCSPWETWGSRAFEYVRVLKANDKDRIQVFINTELGECYGEQGEAPPWEDIMQLREGSGFRLRQVPNWVQRLTCGVDVQGNRLVVVVMGWGKKQGELEACLIAYTEIEGNTAYPPVWQEFAADFLYKEFDGRMIDETGIDSGFNPSAFIASPVKDRNIIYDFIRKHRHRHVFATKGASRQMPKPFKKSIADVKGKQEKPNRKGVTLYELDTDFLKKAVYARLQWPRDLSGHWHFPENAPQQFFEELTAEQLTDEGKWVETGENHVLDCVVINVFLSLRMRLRDKLADVETNDNKPATPVEVTSEPASVAAPSTEPKAAVTSVETVKRIVKKVKRRVVSRGGGWN